MILWRQQARDDLWCCLLQCGKIYLFKDGEQKNTPAVWKTFLVEEYQTWRIILCFFEFPQINLGGVAFDFLLEKDHHMTKETRTKILGDTFFLLGMINHGKLRVCPSQFLAQGGGRQCGVGPSDSHELSDPTSSDVGDLQGGYGASRITCASPTWIFQVRR